MDGQGQGDELKGKKEIRFSDSQTVKCHNDAVIAVISQNGSNVSHYKGNDKKVSKASKRG